MKLVLIVLFSCLAALVYAIVCPPGTFNIARTELCQTCYRGSYSGIYGATECNLCPVGHTTMNMGATNASDCIACNPGFYAPNNGSSSCTPCPSGTYGNTTGAASLDSCVVCPPGYFAEKNATSCQPCAPSTYNPESGKGSCIRCPSGKQSDVYGATNVSSCTILCPAGTSDCLPCPMGTYQPEKGSATPCLNCPANTYSNATGQTSISTCLPCLDGSDSKPGSIFCRNCTFGTYRPHNSSRGCEPCPAGTYQSSSGETECKPCQAGRISLGGNPGCTACGFGKYRVNSTYCAQCPEYTASEAMEGDSIEICKPCNPTEYAAPGSARCYPCTYPRYIDSQTSICKKCPAGEINVKSIGTKEESCQPCPGGTYFSTATETCINCTAGQFQNQTGALSCMVCDAGYTSQVKSVACTPCSPDTISSKGGTCQKCPSQFIASNNGTSCTRCPLGYRTVGSDRTVCVPDGTYRCAPDSPINLTRHWQLQYTASGGFGLGDTIYDRLHLDSNGNLYYGLNIVGLEVKVGSTSFHPTQSAYGLSAFVTKINATGNITASTSYTDPEFVWLVDLATDATGNVYVFGSYTGKLQIENFILSVKSRYTYGPPCSGLYIAKYDSDMNIKDLIPVTKTKEENDYANEAYAGATDSAGNMYMATYILGGGTLVRFNADQAKNWTMGGRWLKVAVGKSNVYTCGKREIQKLSDSGSLMWKVAINDGIDYLDSFALDPNEESIYITGRSYGGVVTIGSTSLSSGTRCAFVASLSASTGEVNWADTLTYITTGVSVDDTGNVYIYGTAKTPVHFDTQDLTIDPNGVSRGFIAKFSKYGQVRYTQVLSDANGITSLVLGTGRNPDFYISYVQTKEAFVAKYSQRCNETIDNPEPVVKPTESEVKPSESANHGGTVLSVANSYSTLSLFNMAIAFIAAVIFIM